MAPVLHHIEMCVGNAQNAIESLKKFGLYLHAQRTTPVCDQWVLKVGCIQFIVTQRKQIGDISDTNSTVLRKNENWTIFCCEGKEHHDIDTVFNVAFRVKNVAAYTKKLKNAGALVIQPPVQVRDQFGQVTYSIVKSCCGNVVHTLINKDDYRGWFLPEFKPVGNSEDCEEQEEWDNRLTHVDHVTLACYPGNSHGVVNWYERCFGMKRFSINSNDDESEGLVLEDGVGLRLKAMEYWRCAEVGLTTSTTKGWRDSQNIMLVVVESLPGQVNCNVENFLREHEGPGIEHIAFSTSFITETVTKLTTRGIRFRYPPKAYYREISKTQQVQEVGESIELLQTLGILLDCEHEEMDDSINKSKYLMQIFTHPIFSRKTCFVEIIQRCGGAQGLGAGNILALVRSIREEEDAMRKEKLREKESIRPNCF